jgi:hypothetical protein
MDRDSVVEHEGRVSVPGIVESYYPEACVPRYLLEPLSEFRRADGFAVEVGSHEVQSPSPEPFGGLLVSVPKDCEGRHRARPNKTSRGRARVLEPGPTGLAGYRLGLRFRIKPRVGQKCHRSVQL